MNTTTRTRAVIATALLAVTLPFSLAACSTGGSDSAPTANDATTGVGARWGACMRDAGFDVTDPEDDLVASGAVSAPQGVDQEQFRTSAGKCSEQVGVTGADSAQKQRWARQYDRVASCIRDNGYPDFPEQQPGAIAVDPETYPRATEPEFDTTFQDCIQRYAPDTKTQQVG